MLTAGIHNNFSYKDTYINKTYKNKYQNNSYPNLAPLAKDTVCFKGISEPSLYESVFDYLGAKIIQRESRRFKIQSYLLSHDNIRATMQKAYDDGKFYEPGVMADNGKIKWKSYVPRDVREFAIDKINDARKVRLDQWKKFLEYPSSHEDIKAKYPHLVDSIEKNPSLKLIIWNNIISELKANNRHITVPFNAKALAQTVEDFESITPKSRKIRLNANSSPSFLEMYTHRMRDNVLEDKGLSANERVWVRIPSIKKSPDKREENISDLETLSHKNWCTRSSVDKAEAALEDGDFYVYLERDKNELWQPIIGMTTHTGKIDQIQGGENNNIVPFNQLKNIKQFLEEKKLKCTSGIINEGPKAYQQILISEKLSQLRPEIGKTLDKAISEGDSLSIFQYMDKTAKVNEHNLLEIGTYKPYYNIDSAKGISIPYAMFGIHEEKLLNDVETIKGDLVLWNKNPLFNSTIREFPTNLKTVTGKIECSEEQYNAFKDSMLNVIKDKSKIIVHQNI